MAITATRPPASRSAGSILRSPTTARILFPIVVIAGWYLLYLALDSRIFPPPHQVFSFMWDELTLNTALSSGSVDSNVYEMFAISLRRLFVGFAFAMVVGTVIGLAMGLSKSVDAFFHDWVMAVLAMPSLVWALFLGLALGFSETGPTIAAFLTGVPFVIINVREGVRNTPKELFDMARAFGVPQNRMTRHVLLPSLMPFMFAAARYGFSLGWKGLVIAEVFAADQGVGWTIKYFYDAHRTHGVIGYALFMILFTLFLEKAVFEQLSKRAFKWRPGFDAMLVTEEAFDELGNQAGTATVRAAEASSADFINQGDKRG
jgi:ABC-type nitrate/sulfonate/bicarbonate transport system permease component